MPESKIRAAAAEKRKLKRHEQVQAIHQEKAMKGAPNERRWVPPLFIACALIGVAWIIAWSVAGPSLPFLAALGNWNMLIGMVLIALSFLIMTLWK
ncbi:MAG: cell division protein CrgA [Propionibacteriaceae bacterium]|jgi:uncharacterized membrane protein YkgB|nr:cell division protein CrgA [Propionibacteriaceae bacterium]